VLTDAIGCPPRVSLSPQQRVDAVCFHGASTPRNAESHPRVASSSSTLLVAGVGFEPTTFRL
jgi:hypothetical protein